MAYGELDQLFVATDIRFVFYYLCMIPFSVLHSDMSSEAQSEYEMVSNHSVWMTL